MEPPAHVLSVESVRYCAQGESSAYLIIVKSTYFLSFFFFLRNVWRIFLNPIIIVKYQTCANEDRLADRLDSLSERRLQSKWMHFVNFNLSHAKGYPQMNQTVCALSLKRHWIIIDGEHCFTRSCREHSLLQCYQVNKFLVSKESGAASVGEWNMKIWFYQTSW